MKNKNHKVWFYDMYSMIIKKGYMEEMTNIFDLLENNTIYDDVRNANFILRDDPPNSQNYTNRTEGKFIVPRSCSGRKDLNKIVEEYLLGKAQDHSSELEKINYTLLKNERKPIYRRFSEKD